MARQLKLPMARVVSKHAPQLEAVIAALDPQERVLVFDMDKVRLSKTYAQLKAQAPGWDDATCDEYALSLIAQGIA